VIGSGFRDCVDYRVIRGAIAIADVDTAEIKAKNTAMVALLENFRSCLFIIFSVEFHFGIIHRPRKVFFPD
jgi:hypothetical protein